MSCDYLTCVEEICKFLGVPQGFLCNSIKGTDISARMLYTFTASIFNIFPLLLEGVTEEVQASFTSWYLRLTAYQMIPPFLVLFTIIAMLGYMCAISFDVSLIMVVLLVVLAVLSYLWITDDVVEVVYSLDDEVKNQLSANWEKYQDQIACSLYTAMFNPSSLYCLT
jgi:hypothetical protein